MTPTHDAPETEIVTAMRACCDGGEGALGHPRVWLSLSHDTGTVDCPYCDRMTKMRATQGRGRI